MQLADFLAINIFQFMLVFARLGVVFIMLPGFSAVYVNPRIRLIFALLVTLLALPMVENLLPPQPESPADLIWLITAEMIVGGFLGSLVQVIMAALELAGQMIATTTGITNALTDDPVTQEQSSIVIGMINLVAVTMIFVTNTHHFLLSAVIDSYNLLVPGARLFTRDMITMIGALLDQAFYMGIKLAAPFLVFELVFQVTSGILARLSPQLNVFFVVMPGKIVLGFAILMVSLPTIILVFLHFMDNSLHGLLTPLNAVAPVR
ncbi:MAG: flagellar biosynthetic protein FliR [Rhodospirillaceae bacterium]|nr:flagellar biosynthetic protein FliR [Rhodospirillaceae bacterium]